MARYSVVIFKEDKNGKTKEPFLASRDPEIVRVVRNFIASRLLNKAPTGPQVKEIHTESK